MLQKMRAATSRVRWTPSRPYRPVTDHPQKYVEKYLYISISLVTHWLTVMVLSHLPLGYGLSTLLLHHSANFSSHIPRLRWLVFYQFILLCRKLLRCLNEFTERYLFSKIFVYGLCVEILELNQTELAEKGFNPSTFRLQAGHASAASLCYPHTPDGTRTNNSWFIH